MANIFDYIEQFENLKAPIPGSDVDVSANIPDKTLSFSAPLPEPLPMGEAFVDVNPQGIENVGFNAQIPMSENLIGLLGASTQGPTQLGLDYQAPMMGGMVSANVQTHTQGVKDMLDNLTAGIRYTRRF